MANYFSVLQLISFLIINIFIVVTQLQGDCVDQNGNEFGKENYRTLRYFNEKADLFEKPEDCFKICKQQNDAKSCAYEASTKRCHIYSEEATRENDNSDYTCWILPMLDISSLSPRLPKVVEELNGYCYAEVGFYKLREVAGNYETKEKCLERCRLQNDATECVYHIVSQKCVIMNYKVGEKVVASGQICWRLLPIDFNRE